MKKKVLSLLLVGAMAASMVVGCGGNTNSDSQSESNSGSQSEADSNSEPASNNDSEPASNNDSQGGGNNQAAIDNLIQATEGTVTLNVWVSETTEYQTVMGKLIEDFKAAYPDVTFEITLGACSESAAKDEVLKDVEAAADVYAFADDQLQDLVAAGALQQVATTYTYDVSAVNSEATVNTASVDGKLYAYPLTASNGYFLYYNSSELTADDVSSWEKLIAAAEAKDAKVGINLQSGWYLYGFFAGAGLEMNKTADGKNECNWNATDTTPTGAQVAESIATLASSKAFLNAKEADAVAALKAGDKIIAFVDGTWDSSTFQEAYGDGYAATKLPTFNAGGKDCQMGSYAGYKFLGVNPYSKNVGWAMLLAEFLSQGSSQTAVYEATGEGPANTEAAASASSPALDALLLQSEFADQQIVGDSFWTPAETLGKSLATNASTDYQALLDEAVAGITQ